MRGGNGFLKRMYVISLEEAKDRLDTIMNAAKAQELALTHFKAVKLEPGIQHHNYGEKLEELGIGSIIFRTDNPDKIKHAGTIGCFLSHRNLLKEISEAKEAATATLILEDDAILPEKLLEKIEAVRHNLPSNWDICFLGKSEVEAEAVKDSVKRLVNRFNPTKNYGTWAYLVKNSSIKDRILPCLEVMSNALDTQYNNYTHKIHQYLIDPKIVDVNIANSSHKQIQDRLNE